MTQSVGDRLAEARDAFQGHEWGRALELFKQADQDAELPPEDIESMGDAAWWAARPDEGIEAFQRAYSAYLAAQNRPRAAYVALTLAREFGVKQEGPVSAGWFKRAEKLLEAEPEGAEHGYLYLRQCVLALNAGNADEAIELGKRAVEVGARVGDANLRAIGSVYQGVALVDSGQVAAGLVLIDDAALAAVNGELGLYATGTVYCNTIATCCEIADFRRASDWSNAARRWSEKHPDQPLTPGDCRVHEAEVLALRGAWAEAEESARRGADELRAFNRLYHVGEALYQIGAIRLRMGDLSAAQDAFRQASELGRDPQPGLSLLLLAEAKVDASMASIARAVEEETSSNLARGRLLPAFVEISLTARDLDLARKGADELESIAATYDTPTLQAAAATARGSVLLAMGDAKAAARVLRAAVKRWQEIDAPYESAQARVLLARAVGMQGDQEGASLEFAAARGAFERLGASPDVSSIDAHLLEREADRGSALSSRATKTFLFTDIVKSTNLIEAIGDDAWLDLLRWHDQALRSLFAEHRGVEMDHAGDGFFVAFDEPGAAIRCAVAIQSKLAEHRRMHGFAPQVRVGVHATSATKAGGAYRGKGVHEAARIGSAAEAGEILASRSTLEAIAGRFAASPPRTVQLKGISQPVEVVAIDWRSAAT
jgi:class 3 adenylate cyclase